MKKKKTKFEISMERFKRGECPCPCHFDKTLCPACDPNWGKGFDEAVRVSRYGQSLFVLTLALVLGMYVLALVIFM